MFKICLSIILPLLCLSLTNASVNIAVGRPATQSSECCGGAPGRAVSGSPNSNWGAGQCTATVNQANPWWSVDLGGVHPIQRVVLLNRADCCPDRLRNVVVYTVSSPPSSTPPNKNAAGSTVCASWAGPGTAGQSVELTCAPGTQGRYLVVQLETTSLLTLCGVEVYSGEGSVVAYNVAVGKPTSQSSECCGGVSSRAVSGTPNAHWGGGQCTATTTEANPWWSVDLQGTFDINKVVLYNRVDCCPDRLRNLVVYVANHLPSPSTPPNANAAGSSVCATWPGPGTAGEIVHINCDDTVTGQYLVIQIQDTSLLTLCGVEVYAVPGGTAGGGSSAQVGELEADLAQAQADLQQAQQALQAALASLEECEEALAPPLPTASATAELSSTAYQFTLDFSGIEYILETSPQHIARDADEFCEQYGKKLAPIENQQTYDGLVTQLKSIAQQTSLTEVATGERSGVNLDKDATLDTYNAAGWNCVTFVPDGDSFKTVGKKCSGERAVLCAAIPIYC